MTVFLPKPDAAVSGPGGLPTATHHRWMRDITQRVNEPASVPDSPPASDPVVFTINGAGSITADGSVAGGEFVVTLEGDNDHPLQFSYYGTDSDGNKGFFPISQALTAGTGIAITNSGYTIVDTVSTPEDLPLTGNAGEAVFVTDAEPGIYAWDGSAFTLDATATGTVAIACDATAAEISYDNTSSGLAATNTQDAIDELAASGGGGSMELVATASVAGSAATSLSVSGLDLATDGRYVMQISLENATASSANISIVFNGDSTATNYYAHAITAGVSGSPTNSTGNNGRICGLDTSGFTDGDAAIQLRRDGKAIAMTRSRRSRTNDISTAQDFTTLWRTAANVTTLDIVSDVANSLAVGSFIRLWKTN